MTYKKSKYNIMIDRPEGCFLWNTCSNALIRLNEDGRKWLEDYDGTQTTGPYFEILERNGCIVRSDLNETGKLLYEEKAVMLDPMPESMHFTIAPGLNCNYNCPYCFEKGHGHGGMMSPAVRILTRKTGVCLMTVSATAVVASTVSITSSTTVFPMSLSSATAARIPDSVSNIDAMNVEMIQRNRTLTEDFDGHNPGFKLFTSYKTSARLKTQCFIAFKTERTRHLI